MITAHTLVRHYLDLRGLAPDVSTWTEEGFAENPPRLVRLRQLKSLFRAFGIPWGPRGFAGGRFLDGATLPAELVARLGSHERRHGRDDQLSGCFEHLLEHRERVARVLAASHGVLEASGLYAYAHRRVVEFNTILEAHVHLLDDDLALLISPEGRSFSYETMVREYGYPDVDRIELDLEWM